MFLSTHLPQQRLQFSQRTVSPPRCFSYARSNIFLISTFRDVGFVTEIGRSQQKQLSVKVLTLLVASRCSRLRFPKHRRFPRKSWRSRSLLVIALLQHSQHSVWNSQQQWTIFKLLQLRVRYNETCPFSDQVVTFHHQWGGPNGPSLNNPFTRSIRVLFSDYLNSYPGFTRLSL